MEKKRFSEEEIDINKIIELKIRLIHVLKEECTYLEQDKVDEFKNIHTLKINYLDTKK